MSSSASGGLSVANFRKVAPNGMGDAHNSYPHAMTSFDDQLYVTTTRDNLVILKMRSPFTIPLDVWPVPLPKDLWDLDLRAQIWRSDPRSGGWQKVFTSPMVRGANGVEVPLSIAFRTAVAFQGASDRAAALYLPTFAPSQLTGSVILRSEDGVTFDVVSEPGLGIRDWTFRSFRTLLPFKGRLFTGPTMGADRGRPNMAGAAVVLGSDDPASGTWEVVNEPSFGDPANLSIFEMVAYRDQLYASTLNVQSGFQIWKTDAEGRPPYRWTRVLTHGAWRGKLNQAAVAMVPFGGDLYLGAAIQNGGYDRIHKVGPAAAELLRVHADDSWDLIAGDARSTPDGMKVPLSGMGPGFNNPFAGYFWQMCEHDGWLYLGTFDSLVFLEYSSIPETPTWPRNLLKMSSLETLLRRCAGFDLWRSRDGVSWAPVTRNGFGNRFNYGVRTMRSTPQGLFVGATNPFGPEVAVRREGGWSYEPNPDGGLEVWLGCAGASVESSREREAYRLLEEQPATSTADDGAESDEELDAAAERWIDLYYGDSGFRGFGYWREGVSTAVKACETLVEELLSMLPNRDGTVLAIGSGAGAGARVIAKRFGPAAVTGACLDRSELRACRANVPEVAFRRIRWPALAFLDGSFDHVLCIDVPALRGNRLVGLREMCRVLRPGGHVVVADIVSTDGIAASYADLLVEAGFVDVQVLNRTIECWISFRKDSWRYFLMRLLSGVIELELLQRVLQRLPGYGEPVDGYVLAVARRPHAAGAQRSEPS